MNEIKYLFIIQFTECNENGVCENTARDTHIVKVIATTKEEAIDKMKKLSGVKHYKWLSWNCEEMLDKLKDSDD